LIDSLIAEDDGAAYLPANAVLARGLQDESFADGGGEHGADEVARHLVGGGPRHAALLAFCRGRLVRFLRLHRAVTAQYRVSPPHSLFEITDRLTLAGEELHRLRKPLGYLRGFVPPINLDSEDIHVGHGLARDLGHVAHRILSHAGSHMPPSMTSHCGPSSISLWFS
jgi:hypothetical protein